MAPAKLQQLLEEAVAHHGAGRLEQAEKIYRHARESAPGHFDVLHLSGTLALQQGRHAEAVDWLSRAEKLNARSAVCSMRLALALCALGHHAEAEKFSRSALRRQPDLAEAWDNLGLVLRAQGRGAEVVSCHERAVALRPDFAPAWSHLGFALLLAGRPTDALAAHDRALTLTPQPADLHYGRALALEQSFRLKEAVAADDAALAVDPGHLEARSHRLRVGQYASGRTRLEGFSEHQAYGSVFAEPGVFPPVFDPAARRKLRVGFLSPHLRAHPDAHFIEPILRHLDRTQFEVFLYHDHLTVDDVSRRLPARGDVWRNFAGQSHDAVEAVIRADAPDILVDLAGHSGGNRLPVFARRVAPVQVSYLGEPATTGLATMDYRLTDAVVDPVGEAEACHTEQLVRFAPTAWTYLPAAASPPPPPAPPCVNKGYITFGCFNHFNQVSDEVLATWALLLRTVPQSHLRLEIAGLGEPAVAAVVRERLRRLEVSEDRLELLERARGAGEHLTLYQQVDIALDTFPFSGSATTCEALWMGVPVITLAGEQSASRVGASLLRALDRTDWIAGHTKDYVKIAAELADNPAELVSIRDHLRDELRHSPLFDYAGQAALFGGALRQCWLARCRILDTVAVA